MKFGLFKSNGALNSTDIFYYVADGLQQLGHTVVYDSEDDIDVPVIWSLLWHGRMQNNQKIYQSYRSRGKNVLVLEVGGIQRNVTWKVALNGINRAADFGLGAMDSNRSDKLKLKLKPWRTDGEHILICAQHNKSEQWRDMPTLDRWIHNTVLKIREHSKRPIVIRPHPRCPIKDNFKMFGNVTVQNPVQIDGTYDDFNLDFQNCWAVVNWSSNPGPQAVIAGVPVFVGADSLAYDVANHDLANIESPQMPDRENWLVNYAHTEWTVDEIRSGIPFKRLTF
jgi:hypothetical protein